MIAFLNGTVAEVTQDNVVLDVRDIGYNVKISSDTAAKLPKIGEQVKLYTYTCVREDAFWLYGFLTKSDLEIFKKCITVNGIGPKGALAILSVLDADTLRFAVASGDVQAISKAPGIGKKTAERLILDLKDKISVTDAVMMNSEMKGGQEEDLAANDQRREAVAALVALGYGQTEAVKAVNSIDDLENMDAGAVLKIALKKIIS